MKFKVKKGDQVIVVSGGDKSKIGEILKVEKKAMRVLVKGVNIKTHHQKPKNDSQGGILKMEKSIHVSNVSHVLDGKAAKTKYVFENGKKELVFRSSGKVVRK